ncbi:Calcium uniporter protein, mitochondrial [Hondaea fermentalgiana]|uniref:Calcium uniporter protein, mitochondrial n=1 Tax=Hondaea fermentalgiana TaxID=2315210 RepID=A0A2R5GTX9_9STRA|nr:Calcium uniporter protein, mitochondrial [Hondaea fermentalgiana]|eukprot:GBG34326.1 Calcium uniporter protein, mitochondrial [Hondaea fermentalgiana]
MDVPIGAVLVALTMVTFIGLRKIGMEHLLMPHQTSIGIGSAWTAVSSVLAAASIVPEFDPTHQMHLLAVFVPQQVMYIVSLYLRKEAPLGECGLAITALGSVIAIMFLRDMGYEEADEFAYLMCAALVIITYLPGMNIRIRIFALLYGLVLSSCLFFEVMMVPLPIIILVEEVALLNVKIQYLPTDPSKRKEYTFILFLLVNLFITISTVVVVVVVVLVIIVDGGFGINNSKPLHLSIQDRFLEENGARKKKGLSLDSRLRIMRMLERMDEENKSGGAHDLFSRRFAHLKSRSEMDFQEFLLADTDGDGRVSNAEWEAFLRKKSLAEAGLEFQEPSALNVEIPLSVQQFSAMADENEGLHVSINGMRYRLTLQPEGRTADVIEHKQERLHDTLVELASMEREKRPLDAQAARHTKRVLTVCLLYLLSQAAVIAKLTFFSRFGWDVMEPITYFITFGTAILGLVFFQYHKIEYSYPALAALLTQRRATKLYVRNGFDISRYTELQSLALKFERQLVVLQPPRSLWSAAAIEENERIFASLSDEDVENAAEAAKDLNGPGKPNEHP